MKNVLRKSALFIFALFILCMFMGCPSPTGGNPDPGTSGTTEDTFTIPKIYFSDENDGLLDEDTDPAWTDLLAEIETKIKEKLNATLGASDAYDINAAWGTIEIDDNYSKLTKTQLDGLTSFFITGLDGVIGEYTYDFSASYSDELGIFIVLTKTPLYTHYTISDITFVGENNETLIESDWATLWTELEAGVITILDTAFGANNWQPPSATGTFTVPEANTEITYEVYKTLKESLASDLDKVIADYDYDFSVEYNFDTKKLSVSFTRISLNSTISVEEIYFRNEQGHSLSSSTTPSWNQFWTIAEADITPILDEAFGDGKWRKAYDYIDVSYGSYDIKYAKYATLLEKLSNDLEITLGGYLYDFTASYDEKNERINVRYTTSPLAEGSTSDYYIVEEIYFKSGTEDFDSYSTPSWDELWEILETDVTAAFNTAFGNGHWDSDYFDGWDFSIDGGSELLSQAEYSEMTNVLATGLDCSISAKNYDFSIAYNHENGVVTVTYETSNLASGESPDYYMLNKVSFVDESGAPVNSESFPSWENIWTLIKTNTESAFNAVYGSNNWTRRTTGEIAGYVEHRLVTLAEITQLRNALSSLSGSLSGNSYGFFADEYNGATESITVRYTKTAISGGSDSDYYAVKGIRFVDSAGTTLGSDTDPKWATISNVLSSEIRTKFNEVFGSFKWQISVNGTIDITSSVQVVEKLKYDALITYLDTDLDTVTFSGYNYNCAPEYDAATGTIVLTLTNPIFVGDNQIFDAQKYDQEGNPVIYKPPFGGGSSYYHPISAELVSSTKNLEIYQSKYHKMDETDIIYLATEFEKQYDRMIDIYGNHGDVDKNEKVIILLYDINYNWTAGAYIAGYFSPLDLFDYNSTYNPNTNEAEILYVESQVSGQIESIFTTVIHEFQHLINTSTAIREDRDPSDLWLNEALSESTEIVILDAMSASRWSLFDADMIEIEGVLQKAGFHDEIMKGNYFYTWGDGLSHLPEYATVSLFMYWLYLNNGGVSIIEDIAQATSGWGTYKAVENALSGGRAWEEILFDWLEANENYTETTAYNGGFIGMLNDTTVQKVPFTLEKSKVYNGGANQDVELHPGDAVLTQNPITLSGTLNSKSISVNSVPVFITVNTETTLEATPISVTLAKVNPVSSNVMRSMQRGGYSLPYVKTNAIPLTQKTIDISNLEVVQ